MQNSHNEFASLYNEQISQGKKLPLINPKAAIQEAIQQLPNSKL